VSNNFKNAKRVGKYYISYKDGTKRSIKRQVNDGWVKELKFSNIKKMERTRWRITKYIETKVMLEYRRAMSNVALVEKAHYIPVSGQAVLYECKNEESSYVGYRSGVSLKYVARPRKKILHPDIGKRWHEASKRLEYFQSCLYLANAVLTDIIDKYARKSGRLPKSNGIECFIINKRKYYFNRTYNLNGFTNISELVFPYYKSNAYHEIQL